MSLGDLQVGQMLRLSHPCGVFVDSVLWVHWLRSAEAQWRLVSVDRRGQDVRFGVLRYRFADMQGKKGLKTGVDIGILVI